MQILSIKPRREGWAHIKAVDNCRNGNRSDSPRPCRCKQIKVFPKEAAHFLGKRHKPSRMENASAEKQELLQGNGTASFNSPAPSCCSAGQHREQLQSWKVSAPIQLSTGTSQGKEWLADPQVLESKKALEQTAPIPSRLDVLQHSCHNLCQKFMSYLTSHPKQAPRTEKIHW